MKKIEKICNRIIARKSKMLDAEYKQKILKACKESKETGYRVSPIELFWLNDLREVSRKTSGKTTRKTSKRKK